MNEYELNLEIRVQRLEAIIEQITKPVKENVSKPNTQPRAAV